VFVHFAFGALRHERTSDEQSHNVIEHILRPRRLKASPCWEFIPAFNPHFGNPAARAIRWDSWKRTDYGAAASPPDLKLVPMAPITYCHVNVNMISFISISFRKLKSSSHPHEYGGFGLVFADRFLKSRGIKRVRYYTEDSVWQDPLVREWNDGHGGSLSDARRRELEKEIVRYRKPATLFPAFRASNGIKLSASPNGTTLIEHYTYDRYEEGYEFRKENEYRIVLDNGTEYLDFCETDLAKVITPDERARVETLHYLQSMWEKVPPVVVFPG
jgi:hypothetical protein